MSFRHTAITEFLYKNGLPEEFDKIQEVLDEYGHFEWRGGGMEGLGYYHGVIKDLDGHETKMNEEKIMAEILQKAGIRIKIVIE